MTRILNPLGRFRRRPIRTAAQAYLLRRLVHRVKRTALDHVVLAKMLGIDDLLIISQVQQSVDELDAPDMRGARLFAREVARLVHSNPSEGNPL